MNPMTAQRALLLGVMLGTKDPTAQLDACTSTAAAACLTLFPWSGVVCDTNRGEAKHQQLKSTVAIASRRTNDNIRHVVRQMNTGWGLRAVAEGVSYIAHDAAGKPNLV